jgi:putative ABC transport system permease protein
MFGNYLVTALRNLERNRLYAAITILGLAAAFAVAILIGQFVRNELTYDHWLPGYQRVYELTGTITIPGQPPNTGGSVQTPVAAQVRTAFPGAEAVARLMPNAPSLRRTPADAGVQEPTVAWADPDIFKVFPLTALAGNLATALQQPDTAVITRAMARKYFGKDLPIGETLQVQAAVQSLPFVLPAAPAAQPWHTVRITAVLKDLPSNTNLATDIFVSGRSAFSTLATQDSGPPAVFRMTAHTFVRLKPRATAADLERVLEVVSRPTAKDFFPTTLHAVPLGEVHLAPLSASGLGDKPVGSRSVAYGLAGVGALIVLVAAINFVTLLTARAARRGVEVGVRKAVGAKRADLMAQFIGETLIQVAFAAVIAGAVAEVLFKPVGAMIQRDLALDFVHDPLLLAGVAGSALLIGLLASIYPALVMSSFRPQAVLKGEVQASGSPLARAALVVVQFAILVGLIVTTTTVYRQTQYALTRGIGDVDNRLILSVNTPCTAFPKEVRKLPGVASAACSSMVSLNTGAAMAFVFRKPGGGTQLFETDPVDFGFFELYGVHPVAGRLFSRRYGQDNVAADPKHAGAPTVVINEAAARVLGYANPKAAIGKPLRSFGQVMPPAKAGGPASEIIGVVPDAPKTVRAPVSPTIYTVQPDQLNAVSIRLTGQDTPATVAAIAAAWKRVNGDQRLVEQSPYQYRQSLYLDLIIQSLTVGVGAGLAVLIACLGLFALSAYTTEVRTKEIGVRKVMGADTWQVVVLLLWQFTLPVLAATAIAIPIGFLVMRWWLNGFVYHTPLSAWTFVFAAVAAVVIAWLTVSWQSFEVARARPAGALRYE